LSIFILHFIPKADDIGEAVEWVVNEMTVRIGFPIMKENSVAPGSTSTDIWSVVVVYEGLHTRERAMTACDQLVNQFWPDVEFKFHWWRTDFLEDEGMAGTAAEYASRCDILIFSGGPEKDLSPRVQRWFENWTRIPGNREKALFDLTETTTDFSGIAAGKKAYLQDISTRSKVEYLSEPSPLRGPHISSRQPTTRQANPVTSTLNRLLHHPGNSMFAQVGR
jgi:hypothetical protein